MEIRRFYTRSRFCESRIKNRLEQNHLWRRSLELSRLFTMEKESMATIRVFLWWTKCVLMECLQNHQFHRPHHPRPICWISLGPSPQSQSVFQLWSWKRRRLDVADWWEYSCYHLSFLYMQLIFICEGRVSMGLWIEMVIDWIISFSRKRDWSTLRKQTTRRKP